MVAELYCQLGFDKVGGDEAGNTTWKYQVPPDFTARNKAIKA
jgi:hypothetical protein